MRTSTEIWVKFQVAGLHWWPDAHEERRYLAEPHRHQFEIRLTAEVRHDNRDLEFHDLLNQAKCVVTRLYPTTYGDLVNFKNRACEEIARDLLYAIPWVVEASVSEDGEFGAVIRRSDD